MVRSVIRQCILNKAYEPEGLPISFIFVSELIAPVFPCNSAAHC
jgi:hypothetical protein